MFQLVWDISRWEMGKGKNVGGKFPAGKRHWENGKNIPPKYRQFWDLNQALWSILRIKNVLQHKCELFRKAIHIEFPDIWV